MSCTGGTESGIYFRCGKDLLHGKFPAGYEAYTGFELPFHTGALLVTTPDSKKPLSLFNPQFGAAMATFQPLEIIARGNRIVIKIAGKTVTDFTDDKATYQKGRIALQVSSSGGRGAVAFKKIEIKELPPAPLGAVADTNRQGPALAPDLSRAKPVYEDHFQDPASGWGIGKEDYFAAGYQKGRYFIDLTPEARRSSFCPHEPAGDFACEVLGRVTGSPASIWSLEIQNRTQDRYLNFQVNGKQELAIVATGQGAETFKSIGPIRHPAIKPGEAFNRLLVVARGNSFETYVNGARVGERVTTEFVKTPATLAVMAISGDKQPCRAEFERFTVWSADSLPISMSPRRYQNALGMEFAVVPKGKTWLGGGGGKVGDEEVEFKQDFYLGVCEVTQEEWEKVMGNNPSRLSRKGDDADAVRGVSEADLRRFPVEGVSWDDSQFFLKRLNEKVKERGWVYRCRPTRNGSMPAAAVRWRRKKIMASISTSTRRRTRCRRIRRTLPPPA